MSRQSKAPSPEATPLIRASNDAFGQTSPHWNLPFPGGRLTAAEILAYCPHWLKSVDVINRFVTNGGKAYILSTMLNQFRILPRVTIPVNSVCVMLQYAMRSAGFKDWVAQDHTPFNLNRLNGSDNDKLHVTGFRTPRITHTTKKAENPDAPPIEFRDLAHNVKEHPSGDDALDLTRCIAYAVNHPEESYLFPVDFELLVDKLGGPHPATHSHLDAQAFKRRGAEVVPRAARTRLSVTPAAKRVRFAPTITMVSTRRSDTRLITPKKRGYDEVDSPTTSNLSGSSNKRRSGRIAELGVKDMREPDSDVSTPYKKGDSEGRARKKRKYSLPSSGDEFVGNITSDSESLPYAQDDVSDDLLSPQRKRPLRASAQKGRRALQEAISRETPKAAYETPRGPFETHRGPYYVPGSYEPSVEATTTPAQHPISFPDIPIDPALLRMSRDWTQPAPVFVKPPVLSYPRLVVDEHSIWLYSDEKCTTREEMWDSALSSTRFNGPRKHAPFRELYRLSDPLPWDCSDWAENIRWAKEQHRAFGVETWTEYDNHLEQITQWRRDNLWVSEQAISRGGVLH